MEPVVSLSAAPVEVLSPVEAASPIFVEEVEQPARQVKPAATRIRTRATGILMNQPAAGSSAEEPS
jgi:hypothetical protein